MTLHSDDLHAAFDHALDAADLEATAPLRLGESARPRASGANDPRGHMSRERADDTDSFVLLPIETTGKSRWDRRLPAVAAALLLVLGAGAIAMGGLDDVGSVGTMSAQPGALGANRSEGFSQETPSQMLEDLIERGAPHCAEMVANGGGVLPADKSVPDLESLRNADRIPIEGFGCAVGYVDNPLLWNESGSESRAPRPIYASAESDSVVGYWVLTVGWLPTWVVESDSFDQNAWVEAAEARVERALETDRITDGSAQTADSSGAGG